MITVTFTDFRKRASDLITEVQHGETVVILRHGKPVAEVVPFSDEPRKAPAWKQPVPRLRIKGRELSSVILEDRGDAP